MKNNGTLSGDCALIQSRSPIIHNITNYVAMGISANALLAIGASPLMSSEPGEMEDISRISDALIINIGCLEASQAEAAETAAREAFRSGKPWVLDPVGAGLSRLRHQTAVRLVKDFRPSVIRGNASEILALCDADASPRGVGAGNSPEEALGPARHLAIESGSVISISGPVDIITDGHRTVRIEGGSAMMAGVSAMGCTASALTGAFAAVEADYLQAAAFALALMARAGTDAGSKSRGPGSFAVNFIDALYRVNCEEAVKHIRYE